MTTTSALSPLQQQLTAIHACSQAITWVGSRDLKTAWAECQNPEWMTWLIAQTSSWTPALRKAYEEGKAQLQKAYAEGMAPLRKAYDEGVATLIRSLFPNPPVIS